MLQTDLLCATPRGVVVSDGPLGLSAIKRPDCAAALWHRRPLPRFQRWIDALAPEQLPRTRIILRPQAVRDAMQAACTAAGTPDAPEREMLIDDVAALADIFADIMGAGVLRLRVDPVATNACRKFHIDAVTARMICTYRGPGTQYRIEGDKVAPDTIHDVPQGSAIILRGTDWPTSGQTRLRHRSPPIEGTDTTRLLVVLDPVAGLEDDE